jgi:formylglycine-generating enzyme required for sulfatase activity
MVFLFSFKSQQMTKKEDPFAQKMIFVKGGSFNMGSNIDRDEEKPIHHVSISDFYICKIEVTQQDWKMIMGKNPSYYSDCERCPVENINLDDINAFILRLNQIAEKKYRLPTEAEWEYAALGGIYSKGYLYAGSNNISAVCWYRDNSGDRPHEVATKDPNELGIYDMCGNIGEYCQDWYSDESYSKSEAINPKGPISGINKVVRGGNWITPPYPSRIKARSATNPKQRNLNDGFRLVRD